MRDFYRCVPQIQMFPEYDADGSTALIIRMWDESMENHVEMVTALANRALWGMRSWLLNSDAREHNVQPLFYIEQGIANITVPICEKAGVPGDAIHIWNVSELVPGAKFWGHNVAPLVDVSLEGYDNLVIVDDDFFPVKSLSCESTLSFFQDVVSNLPDDMFTNALAWSHLDIKGWLKNYMWLHSLNHEDAINEWVRKACVWCESSPEKVKAVMLGGEKSSRPRMDGFFIHIPMNLIRNTPEFREFMRRCSLDFQNEEVGAAMWELRHYFRTGEKLHPRGRCLADILDVMWSVGDWVLGTEPKLLHFYHAPTYPRLAKEFALACGATDTESEAYQQSIVELYSERENDRQ